MANGNENLLATFKLDYHLSDFDFYAVLFLIRVGYLSSSEPTLTIGVSLERKITWLSTGGNIFCKY